MSNFMDVKGNAGGRLVRDYKYRTGHNALRLVGPILPRYVYFDFTDPKTKRTVPLDALHFDREKESFGDSSQDPVSALFGRKYTPKWSYAILGFDVSPQGDPNKILVVNLKKNLYKDIRSLAQKRLGDPTDPEDGWTVVFEREDPGTGPFGIKYVIDPFECSSNKGALTDAQKEVYEATPPISELLPPLSFDQQKEFLDNFISGGEGDEVKEADDV